MSHLQTKRKSLVGPFNLYSNKAKSPPEPEPEPEPLAPADDCVDSETWNAGYGDCSTYEKARNYNNVRPATAIIVARNYNKVTPATAICSTTAHMTREVRRAGIKASGRRRADRL